MTPEELVAIRVKPILDACCGGRQFWFDKTEPGVVFMDCRTAKPTERTRPGRPDMKRWPGVQPDVIGDFRAMPFADATFRLVVFDPPHLSKLGSNSRTAMEYGRLDSKTWREDIRSGFSECFRVLDPSGFLIFKWNEYEIPVSEVHSLAGDRALFGHKSGKHSKTHWLTFSHPLTRRTAAIEGEQQ